MLGRAAGWLLASAGLAMGLAGCGGPGLGSTTPPTVEPTSVIFVAAPPASLAINASATLDAAATYSLFSGGNENTAVTYAVSCASAGACGTFSPSNELGAIVYKAPSAVPSGGAVVVTATSMADTKLSVSTTITITPPLPIAVTFLAAPPASMQAGSMFTMSAEITNDVSANPELTWSVSCGTSACGSFSVTTATNEEQTTFTAPPAVPPNGNVTVTATSVTDPTKSASAQIAILQVGAGLANGTYVFQMSGVGGSQSSFITGAFTAQNGTVTGGEQDSVYYESDADDDTNAYTEFDTIAGGSYAITYDGNVQITLLVGGGYPETLSGTLGPDGRSFAATVDGAPMSGTLDPQTSTAGPSGGYALQLTGGDEYMEAAWIAGILNFDSASGISGAGSELDVIDGALERGTATGSPDAVGASTVSAPDAWGRVTIQLEPGTGSALPPVYLAAYMIDATHMRLIETGDLNDSINFQGALGGTALGQGANTGKFTASSVAGASYVFGAQGSDEQGTLQMAGLFRLGAGGSAPGELSWNDLSGSTPGPTPVSFSGSYTVDAEGRATLTNVQNGAGSTYTMHVYLTGDGNGFVLSSDQNDVFAGQIFEQQTGGFTASSFAGEYGMSATQYATYQATEELQPIPAMGSVTVTAGSDTDTVSGYADNGNAAADFAIAGSLTPAANGVFAGTLAGFTPGDRGSANDFTLYLVDGTQGVLIETDDVQLTLGRVVNLQ